MTVAGRTHSLEAPFQVFATQNPIEQEGTYPLPEAQLDRFMLSIEVGYPSEAEEMEIVRRTTVGEPAEVVPVLDRSLLLGLQSLVRRLPANEAVTRYAVRLARATRETPSLSLGAGPRGAIALTRAARGFAALEGRDFVVPDDVKRVALPALRHRVQLAPELEIEGRGVDE
ncbi:MAG: MoxR family ATPase, partial [Planctomycetes bacterium]|nr:MoxR family ATPase [Planctomycetota bacterium]